MGPSRGHWVLFLGKTMSLSTQVYKWVPLGKEGAEILLFTLCYRNRDKLRPDEPLGSYADFTFLSYSDKVFAFSSNLKYFGLSYPGGLGSSVILGNLDRKNYLEKLISFLDPVLLNSQRSGFVRCWHAKTDGSSASTFHSNCDGKGPTVTIIKSGSYIFGGYTDVSWHSS